MSTSMDDILSEKPERPAAVPDKAEAPAVDAPAETDQADKPTSRRSEHRKREFEAQGRGPDGKFLPKDDEAPATEAKEPAKEPAKPAEKPAAAAQPEMTERERGLLRAAEAERQKRQDLERRLAESAKPATDKPAVGEPKKFWDDPEGALKAEEQKREHHAMTSKLQVSEMIARSKYADFDEKVAKFAELAGVVPGLGQQMLASPNPAEFVYNTAKNHISIEQAGSVDKLLAERETKVRAEERAKVEAEYKAKLEDAERKRSELPGSLSDVRGAAPNKTTPNWGGPTPMGDILKR